MNLLRNLINSLKQGYKNKCILIYFRYKKNLFILRFLKLLTNEGYILGFNVLKPLQKQTICIKLKYSKNGLPAIFFIKNLAYSKNPIYISIKALYKKKIQFLLTTKAGLLTKKTALVKNIGGKCLCKIN